MNRPLLVKGDTTIKVASGTEEVHGRLPVVAHVRVVDLGLGDNQSLCSKIIPLNLSAISLVKGL